MINNFFNKINCSVIHKKKKIKINFIKKKIEKGLKKFIFIKNITRNNIEIAFNRKKSLNNQFLRIIKKKLNGKN
jgi:hypothetical protein